MRATFTKFGPRLAWLAACAGAVAACSSSSGEGTTMGDGGAGSASSSGSGSGAASGSGSSSGASGSGSGSGSGSSSGSGGSGGSGGMSAGAGTGSANGTFGGQALSVQGALAATITNTESLGAAAYGYVVFLANIANICELAATMPNATVHGAQELTLAIGTASPLAPGTFAVIPPAGTAATGATVTYQIADTTCAVIGAEQAVSGSVTIATASSSEITGAFDIVLSPVSADGTLNTAQMDHVTGSFSAPYCPAFSAAFNESDDGGSAADAMVCN